MKKVFLFLLVSIVFVLALAANSMAWTLVYANDANGNATYGNLQTLIDAVVAGKQVRVKIGSDDSFYNTIWAGVNNNVVYAQTPQFVGASFDGTALRFNAPGYWAYYNFNSNGTVDLTRWRIGEHTSEGENTYQFALKWFVD